MGTRFPYVEKFGTWDEDGYYYGDIGTSNYYYTGLTYSRIASSSITWEVAKKHDLGLDFSMFNDKFSGSLDYSTNSATVFIWYVVTFLKSSV